MNSAPTRNPVDTDELIEALEAVLARYWSAELFDYRLAGGPDSPEGKEHPFLKLDVIRRWLDHVEEG
ncbi:MAG: hypothetical protein ACYDC1_16760 [Limisphaerales bacterium]